MSANTKNRRKTARKKAKKKAIFKRRRMQSTGEWKSFYRKKQKMQLKRLANK